MFIYQGWQRQKNMQIKPHTHQWSPVDSVMAHHLNECIKCAVVALLPVDWVYYQEISIIAKCPFPLNEPLFKLFHNVLSCSAFTAIVYPVTGFKCTSLFHLFALSMSLAWFITLFYFCGTINLRQIGLHWTIFFLLHHLQEIKYILHVHTYIQQ